MARTHTFTEDEARMLAVLLSGEVDIALFFEGGDYQRNWAQKAGLQDLDTFLRKMALLPDFR